jgi:hypothetical protein
MTDRIRRGLVFALATAGGGLLLGGCASAPASREPRRYTETITSVLASQDHRHLVAIGKDHHYVFDVPDTVARSLRSPARAQLNAVFTPFHVNDKGEITGDVTLQMPAGASAEAQHAADDIGLVAQADGSRAATLHLTGRRYSSWAYKHVDQTQEKLGHAYTIEVTTDETLDEVAIDKAVTPVRIAADGVQLIYYAALAPIIIPFVFLTKAKDH